MSELGHIFDKKINNDTKACLMGMAKNELTQLLFFCCNINNFNMIYHILSLPEFKNKIDIHIEQDQLFKLLCAKNQYSLLEFLILDYQIKQTEEILKITKDYPYLIKIFQVRNLQNLLKVSSVPKLAPTGKMKL